MTNKKKNYSKVKGKAIQTVITLKIVKLLTGYRLSINFIKNYGIHFMGTMFFET